MKEEIPPKRDIAEIVDNDPKYGRDIVKGITNPQPRLVDYFIRYKNPQTAKGFAPKRRWKTTQGIDAFEEAMKQVREMEKRGKM